MTVLRETSPGGLRIADAMRTSAADPRGAGSPQCLVDPKPTSMTAAFIWPIKASFLTYVAAMSDGRCDVEAPAIRNERGFAFPAAERSGIESTTGPGPNLQFRGGIVFTGHHGMLNIAIRDPHLHHDECTGSISIADPDRPGRRMTLAVCDMEQHVNQPSDEPSVNEVWRGVNLRLTADGADLFFRAYEDGDPLDDFTVRIAPAADRHGRTSAAG
jgi:hypothetical protein